MRTQYGASLDREGRCELMTFGCVAPLLASAWIASTLFVSAGCGGAEELDQPEVQDVANVAVGPTWTTDNGVIRVEWNGPWGSDRLPVITGLWILGTRWLPNDNPGADFQMAVRSRAGNAWNPTQGGDCRENVSTATGWIVNNWTPSGVSNSARYGSLLGVRPLLFNDYGGPPEYCHEAGSWPSPLTFNFGATLGDGAAGHWPKEVMILDQSFSSSPQALVLGYSELPAAFWNIGLARYAFYSTSQNCQTNWYAFPGTGGRNDVTTWQVSPTVNYTKTVNCIALSNSARFLTSPDAGIAVAFYSKKRGGVQVDLSRRKGLSGELSMMSFKGSANNTETATSKHYRRVLAVGNLNTIKGNVLRAYNGLSGME